MTRALLDVNVLIALLDRDHVDHGRLHGHRQATVAYPLAPATANGGRLATLDLTLI